MQDRQAVTVQQHVSRQVVISSVIQVFFQLTYNIRVFQGVCRVFPVYPLPHTANASSDTLGFLLFPQGIYHPVKGGFHSASVKTFPSDPFPCFLQKVHQFGFPSVSHIVRVNGDPALQHSIIHTDGQILRQSPFQRLPFKRRLIASGQHITDNTTGHVVCTVPPCAGDACHCQMAVVFLRFLRSKFIPDSLFGSLGNLEPVHRKFFAPFIPVQVTGSQPQHIFHRHSSVKINHGV